MDSMKAFAAGFISTLTFHQGLLAFLHGSGRTPRAPYVMDGVPPFGVPQVISLAFFGGLWGIVLWAVIRKLRGASFWLNAIVLGAIAPSLAALFIVFPLKGLGVAGGWDPQIIVGALLLNGAWGLGVAILLRLMRAELPDAV
jgi:hypothetical protein